MDEPLKHSYGTESLNISRRGVYFHTDQPVFIGQTLRLTLQMPVQCGGTLATPMIFTGRVSHMEGETGQNRTLGVGVEFFYSEPPELGDKGALQDPCA